MACIVLIHGAHTGGWVWSETANLLGAMGYEVHASTLIGGVIPKSGYSYAEMTGERARREMAGEAQPQANAQPSKSQADDPKAWVKTLPEVSINQG